jgi:hypothetical protein
MKGFMTIHLPAPPVFDKLIAFAKGSENLFENMNRQIMVYEKEIKKL